MKNNLVIAICVFMLAGCFFGVGNVKRTMTGKDVQSVSNNYGFVGWWEDREEGLIKTAGEWAFSLFGFDIVKWASEDIVKPKPEPIIEPIIDPEPQPDEDSIESSGILWRGASETGKVGIILPPAWGTPGASIEAGERVLKGNYTGNCEKCIGFDGGAVYRWNVAGKDLPKPVILQVGDRRWTVPEPGAEYDPRGR